MWCQALGLGEDNGLAVSWSGGQGAGEGVEKFQRDEVEGPGSWVMIGDRNATTASQVVVYENSTCFIWKKKLRFTRTVQKAKFLNIISPNVQNSAALYCFSRIYSVKCAQIFSQLTKLEIRNISTYRKHPTEHHLPRRHNSVGDQRRAGGGALQPDRGALLRGIRPL